MRYPTDAPMAQNTNVGWERSKQLQCPCPRCAADPSRRVPPTDLLVQALQWITDYSSLKLTITSGVRCKEHNADVGGAPSSLHLTGEAADIAVTSSDAAFGLVEAAMAIASVTFIELCPLHVHVDVRDRPQRRLIVGKG